MRDVLRFTKLTVLWFYVCQAEFGSTGTRLHRVVPPTSANQNKIRLSLFATNLRRILSRQQSVSVSSAYCSRRHRYRSPDSKSP